MQIHTQTQSHHTAGKTRAVLQVTLLAAALALAGCSSSDDSGGGLHANKSPLPTQTIPGGSGGTGGNGSNNGGTPGNNGGTPGDNGTGGDMAQSGPLQGALQNTGNAVDNVNDLALGDTLGALGEKLDGPLSPLYNTIESTTQAVGDKTRLGQPVDGVLQKTGGALSSLGDKLGDAPVPGGLTSGTGALVSGLGQGLISAGGLVNQDPNNPHPLAQTLAHVTGGVQGLTGELTGQGGLLHPLVSALDTGLGDRLGIQGQPILQPTLANTGLAVDQIAPLGLQEPLGKLGHTLDGVAAPVGSVATLAGQKVGDGLGVGAPVNQLLSSVGGGLQQVSGGANAALPLGLGGVTSHLGAAVASVGGVVHQTPNNPNPLGNTLNQTTQAVVSLTNGLGVTQLTGNVTNITQNATGAEGNAAANAGNGGILGKVLSPVTGLLGKLGNR